MNLTPEQRSFVDAVVKPLGDDESRRELLEESLVLTTTLPNPPKGDPVEVASARMEAKEKSFALRRRLVPAALVVAVLVIPWLIWLSPESRSSFKLLFISVQSSDSFVSSDLAKLILGDRKERESVLIEQIVARLPPDERLIAMGDVEADDPVLRWKAVWSAHPNEPAHFMAYAASVRSHTENWPADLVETGERLDPGNGWFRLLRVAARVDDAITPPVIHRGRPKKGATSATPSGPSVKDETVFAEIVSDLEQLVSMPRLDNYRSKLNSTRLRGWTAPVDYPDHVLSRVFCYEHPETLMLSFREVEGFGDLFMVAAGQAAGYGDSETLDRHSKLFHKTFSMLAENPAWMNQRIAATRAMVESGRAFSSAYMLLGDSSKAAAFESVADGLDRRKAKHYYSSSSDALDERRGSQLACTFSSSGLPGMIPVREEELRGGRLAEHAMTERFLFHGVALLMGLALLLVLLLSLRFRRSGGLLSSRLEGLLSAFDRLVIALAGIAVPSMVYAAVVHAPWSRSLDFMIDQRHFDKMLVQLSALSVSVMICTLQTIRWSLGRRGAALALGWNGFDPGWWLVPMALSGIPVAEYLPEMFDKWSVDDDWTITALWSLVGLPFAWLVVLAIGHLSGSAERRLHRAIILKAMAPFMAMAMILAAMTISLLHRVEKKWTRQIDFEAVTAARIAFESRVNSEHANWLRAEQLRHLRELE